jgi:hypothetical protein
MVMSRRNMSEKTAESRGGLGVRFWNFVDRVTIGPARASEKGRRTGGRI